MSDLTQAFEEALALHHQGRLRDAFERYAKILDAHPDSAPALHYSGVVLLQSGEPSRAVDLIRRAIAIDNAPAEPWNHLGLALDAVERREAAVNAFKEAARRAPTQAEIWSNLAGTELALARLDDAEASAKKAVEVDPQHAAGWFNLALVLEAQGRILAALDAASRAAAVRPDEIAHAGLVAQLQEGLGQFAAARKTLEGAIARRPTTSALHSQLARVHELAGDFTAAAASLENALRLAPDDGPALSQLLFVRKQLADWRRLPDLRARFRKGVLAGRAWMTPFLLLSDPSTRAEQRVAAVHWSAQFETSASPGAPRSIGEGRLRIGYLSSDYYDHPTVALIAGAIEAHDRGRVEVVGYSTGHNDGSPSRARIEKAFDRFVDAAHWSPDQIAARIRADAIDILIDLKGHTAGAPTSVLARRPAPIQAHYLGYPGTLGAMFIDYLIGDSVVTPLPHAADYAEALVLLPGSYQANDRSRTAATAPSRRELGLPEDAVVLCCFNNTYKLNPAVLDAWSRILTARSDAVLWLLAKSATDPAIDNLRREIADRGVDASRLVFAAHRPRADYLALYTHADLFVDTWPYNAHTTASDALWMGCPVVTWLGETFAGRVGASLLTAVGLPELVASDVDRYVESVLALAGDATKRAALRDYLLGPGRSSPLFDAARTARALESAYGSMAADFRQGVRRAIVVPA